MSKSENFHEELNKLNPAQRDAVENIDGPVMVIAGPGTGKTQVLALRIANILEKTDTPASGILCLTFTRSGVTAMRNRLFKYIGNTAHNVRISTFHSFAISIIEKHYLNLDFTHMPQLLDDKAAVFLVDELLHAREWEHLRPRGNPTTYFYDIKSLISLLKRERMSPSVFQEEIDNEINLLKSDPDSISSRGATKGELKKEVKKKIESLERTREVVEFYAEYESMKRERSLMDYDDVLEYAVQLVQENEDVQAAMKEDFLYVLVDEHQDSSGIQNSFLKSVWGDTEKPNIFVVGDDRQLIYGFGGASLSYFEEFKTAFGKAKLITLVENYRSTTKILSLADTLLSSDLTSEKLKSNKAGAHDIYLKEYAYSRDEIIAAGLEFKKMIESGVPANECALLVPKNHQVRSALHTLRMLGVPVSGADGQSFFDVSAVEDFRTVLLAISDPYDSVAVAKTLFSQLSNISVLTAHSFARTINMKKVSLSDLAKHSENQGLFEEQNPISTWGKKLEMYVEESQKMSLVSLLSLIGNDVLISSAGSHDRLLENTEALRTFFHIAEMYVSANPHKKLKDFLEYLTRLESYGAHIPLAVFSGHEGVSVMTLHKSKGLEFESVWIAHMNEETLMSSKRGGFTLPEIVKEKMEEKDLAVAKREVYVAVTRAKSHCAISYAKQDYKGAELELAEVIRELDENHFVKSYSATTEKELLSHGADIYVKNDTVQESDDIEKMTAMVAKEYSDTRVSVSLLNNFFDCPWRWYFRNFLQLPEIKSDSLSLGSAVHAAIELVLKSTKVPSDTDIKECIVHSLEKEGVIDERTTKTLIKDAMKIVREWIDTSYSDVAQNHESEKHVPYTDPAFPHLYMYGKIDLTEHFPDGSIAVTDFKTGGTKTPGVIEKIDEEGRLSSYMRQLAMYSYLIEGSTKKSVSMSKLYFLEADKGDKNKVYQTRVSQEHIDLLVRDIKEYNTLLNSGEWVKKPCNAKLYGGGSTCEHCDLAKKIYKK